MTLPRIGLTVGDPAGIGPEITQQAVRDPRVTKICEPVIYGSELFQNSGVFEPGILTAEGGRAAFEVVRTATTDALAGRIDAIATAPINKAAWRLAGLEWQGHTDLLAHLTGSSAVAMMFCSDRLRVVLATVHIPLAQVPKQLTSARIQQTIELAHTELPWFGFSKPRLVVAGLNPHAGEQGIIGYEDEEILRPTINTCRASGIDVSGPFPADTVFIRGLKGEYDAVIACYHDQGLIPIKLVAFNSSVNVTLGLPIIRTSVDHGTAYDIAGKGVADPSSMISALVLAAKLANRRFKFSND